MGGRNNRVGLQGTGVGSEMKNCGIDGMMRRLRHVDSDGETRGDASGKGGAGELQ